MQQKIFSWGQTGGQVQAVVLHGLFLIKCRQCDKCNSTNSSRHDFELNAEEWNGVKVNLLFHFQQTDYERRQNTRKILPEY